MGKYYVITDTHSCYTEVEAKLKEVGFFEDKDAMLIFCGDYLDRGKEPEKMIFINARSGHSDVQASGQTHTYKRQSRGPF